MAAFVPTDMSLPAERGYLADLERLLEDVHVAMGGSVLTLFTNRRDMEHLHAILEPRLERAGIALLCQKRGTSAKRLRDEFLADERLSLFALKSFWEGFDAKGDTLRCVVVPKLPVRPSHRPARQGARTPRRPAGVEPLHAARGGPRAQAGGRAPHPQPDRRRLPRHRRRARGRQGLRTRVHRRAAGGRHREAAGAGGRRGDQEAVRALGWGRGRDRKRGTESRRSRADREGHRGMAQDRPRRHAALRRAGGDRLRGSAVTGRRTLPGASSVCGRSRLRRGEPASLSEIRLRSGRRIQALRQQRTRTAGQLRGTLRGRGTPRRTR